MEAALFISTRPLTIKELGDIIGVSSLGTVREMVEELKRDYKGGTEIVETPEGWQMQVRQELLPKVAHLTPYSDLSEGCKRTLALAVYKEPAKQAEIIKIQGNKAYSYIRELKRRGLIRTEKEGKTVLIKLTQEFESYFGEEKERLRERMIKEMEKAAPKKSGAEAAGKVESAEGVKKEAEEEGPERGVEKMEEEKAEEKKKEVEREGSEKIEEGKSEAEKDAETAEAAEGEKKEGAEETEKSPGREAERGKKEKSEEKEGEGKEKPEGEKGKAKGRKPVPADEENEYIIKV